MEGVAVASAASPGQYELLAGCAEEFVWGLVCKLADGQPALWEGRARAGWSAAGDVVGVGVGVIVAS